MEDKRVDPRRQLIGVVVLVVLGVAVLLWWATGATRSADTTNDRLNDLGGKDSSLLIEYIGPNVTLTLA